MSDLFSCKPKLRLCNWMNKENTYFLTYFMSILRKRHRLFTRKAYSYHNRSSNRCRLKLIIAETMSNDYGATEAIKLVYNYNTVRMYFLHW